MKKLILFLSILFITTSVVYGHNITSQNVNPSNVMGYDKEVPDNYFFEGFERTNFPPYGWENQTGWERFSNDAYEGEGYARTSRYHTEDAILITPQLEIDSDMTISFYWINADLYDMKGSKVDGGDTLYIEISNTYESANPQWETLTGLSADGVMSEYEYVSLPIPSNYVGTPTKIRFRHHSLLNVQSRGVGIDNVVMPSPYYPLYFTITPEYQSDYNAQSTTIDYEIDVTNEGIWSDRYFISILDSKQWDVSTMPAYIDLDPNEVGVFTISVTVPEDAILYEEDITPIQITSREDPTLIVDATIKTTCNAKDPYEPNDRMAEATDAYYGFISEGAQIYYNPDYKDKDIDIYAIDCLAGDIVACTFDYADNAGEFDGYIQLVNADSTECAYANEFGPMTEYLKYRIGTEGTYYWILGKVSYDKNEETTYYTVTFKQIPPPEIEISPISITLGTVIDSGGTVEDELSISNTAVDSTAEILTWNIDIVYSGSDSSWLSVSSLSGSVSQGNTETVSVICDADSRLEPGTYYADIIVHNNALIDGLSDITIPVVFYITEEAEGLQGTVTCENLPLEDVMVKVGDHITYTDEYGFYSFTGIPSGYFNVYFYKKGYKPYWEYDIYLDPDWIVILDTELDYELPEPEMLDATGISEAIELNWNKPGTGVQVEYTLDNGTFEGGSLYAPYWFGNQYPTMDEGEIISFDIYGLLNEESHDTVKVTIDVFDSEKNYVGSTDRFNIPAESWLTVPAPDIPFEGDFYAMVHWTNPEGLTNYLGFDTDGPYATEGLDWFYEGTTWYNWPLDMVFGIRVTAMVHGRGAEVTKKTYGFGREPQVEFRQVDNTSFLPEDGDIAFNELHSINKFVDSGNHEISHYTIPDEEELLDTQSKDITLLGYNIYEQDKGFVGYVEGEDNTSFIDDIVAVGEEYTYWVTAMYDKGESDPSNTDTASPLGSSFIFEDYFDKDWATTGWYQTPPEDGNWYWLYDSAFLSFHPSTYDYDVSLYSPEIQLPSDPLDIDSLIINMVIVEYVDDDGEVMEISIIHNEQEDIIFLCDLDIEDGWGAITGSDFIYNELDQYAGQSIQLRFRSYGGYTMNYEYWLIHSVVIEGVGLTPDYGALEGVVTDAGGNPIKGVQVTANPADYNSVYTDDYGYYIIDPMTPGEYDISFYEDNYCELWVYDVEIENGVTTVIDTILGSPTIHIEPASVNVNVPVGGIDSTNITITNNGDIALDWTASINFMGKAKVSIPAVTDVVPHGIKTISSGRCPKEFLCNNNSSKPISSLMKGSKGYGYEAVADKMCSVNLDEPGTINYLFDPEFESFAGDYDPESNDCMYLFNNETYNLMKLKISTTEITTIGSTGLGYVMNDMACDRTTGMMYGVMYNDSDGSNKLYTVNLNTGYCTYVGDIGNPEGNIMIAIAIDGNGDMWGHNLGGDGDEIWYIDKETGAGTSIGLTGFNANYAQSMAWDPSTNTVYLAAFNWDNESFELRIVDTSTGATTSLGSAPGQEITLLGFPCMGWISMEPLSGTINPYGSTQEAVIYFNTGPDYSGSLSYDIVFESLQGIPSVTLPVTFTIGTTEYGTLAGTVTDLSTGNPIAGATIIASNNDHTYETYTNGLGEYTIQMVSGSYDIDCSAESYNDQCIYDVVIYTDDTTTQNISMTAPVLVVNPSEITVNVQPDSSTTVYVTIENAGNGSMDYTIDFYELDKSGHDISSNREDDDVIIQYQNGFNTAVEPGGCIMEYEYTCAIRFTPEELGQYYGSYNLSQVNIYLASSCFYMADIKVWEGGSNGDPGTEIYSQDIMDTALYGEWTEHTLSTPITLEGYNEYWIGYHIAGYDEPVCGVDSGPAEEMKGDWICYNGSWIEIYSEFDLDYNWCIQGVLTPSAEPWISVEPLSGTVPAGEQIQVAVDLSASGLVNGDTKYAEIEIVSEPDVGTVTIPVTMNVVEISTGEIPVTETILYSNFPNPCLNTTTFSFSIKERSHVTLSVYNVRGQLVKTLLDEEVDPTPEFNIKWDGTANGKQLANGIYFYKLETKNKSFLKKMILMK